MVFWIKVCVCRSYRGTAGSGQRIGPFPLESAEEPARTSERGREINLPDKWLQYFYTFAEYCYSIIDSYQGDILLWIPNAWAILESFKSLKSLESLPKFSD